MMVNLPITKPSFSISFIKGEFLLLYPANAIKLWMLLKLVQLTIKLDVWIFHESK